MKTIMLKNLSVAVFIAFAVVFAGGVYVADAQSVTATNITCNSTIFNGDVSISPSGTPTNVWFQWGRASVLENNTNQQLATYSSSFSQPVYGLSPSTTYYYRAAASNAPFGTVYGATYSFTTPSCGVQSTATVVTQTVPAVKTVTSYVKTRSLQASLVNLTMISDNERVCSGENIGFTVEYINTSNQTLKSVALRVDLPGELTYKGSSSGVFSDKDNALTVDIGTLSPGEKGKITVRVTANSSLKESNTLVTTSSLVYTTAGDVQEEVVAYSLSKLGCYNSNSALAFYGGNFFPNTLIGWLILIIIIVLIVILSRKVYGSYNKQGK